MNAFMAYSRPDEFTKSAAALATILAKSAGFGMNILNSSFFIVLFLSYVSISLRWQLLVVFLSATAFFLFFKSLKQPFERVEALLVELRQAVVQVLLVRVQALIVSRKDSVEVQEDAAREV